MPLVDSGPEHPPVQDSQFDHASENLTAMSNSPAEVDGDTWFNFVRGMQSPPRRDQMPHPTQQQLPTHLRNLPYEASAQEEKWKENDNVGEVAEGEINNMTKGKEWTHTSPATPTIQGMQKLALDVAALFENSKPHSLAGKNNHQLLIRPPQVQSEKAQMIPNTAGKSREINAHASTFTKDAGVGGMANASRMHVGASPSRMVKESQINVDGDVATSPVSSPSDPDSLYVAVVKATDDTVLESARAIRRRLESSMAMANEPDRFETAESSSESTAHPNPMYTHANVNMAQHATINWHPDAYWEEPCCKLVCDLRYDRITCLSHWHRLLMHPIVISSTPLKSTCNSSRIRQ